MYVQLKDIRYVLEYYQNITLSLLDNCKQKKEQIAISFLKFLFGLLISYLSSFLNEYSTSNVQ